MHGKASAADSSPMRVSSDSGPLRPTHGGRARRALGSLAVAGALLVGLAPDVSAAPNPTITIGDVTVVEGSAGTTNAVFTIQVAPTPKPCCSLQVGWATAPGTALAPADYTTSSGTVTLNRSTPSRTVVVPVVGDTVDEVNETFVVNLSNLTGSPGTIGDAQGVGTITDDDGLPALSVNDVTVTEGNAGTTTATFTISLSAASGQAVTVNWATTAGTAAAGTDYVAANGSRTVAAGSTTATVGITVNGDAVDEDDETFGLALSNLANATIGDGSGAGTITDDDPLPALSISEDSVTEGNAGTQTMTFTVTLSAPSSRTVTVQWATADDVAVAPGDYAAAGGTPTFSPGQTSKSVNAIVNGDIVAEIDESFLVALSTPTNAAIGDGLAVGTIVDDELLPVIDIDAPSVTEGNAGTTALTFTISLSHPSAGPVTVDWATAAGTATVGTDFVSGGGTVTFASLQTSKTISVTVNGDGLYEAEESVVVTLSNATNAPIGRPQRHGFIANDDVAPVVSVSDESVTEGDAGSATLRFTLTTTSVSGADATVDYATSDGTLVLDLSEPTHVTLGDAAAQGTIENDDRIATSITLEVRKSTRTISAKGILEPTAGGHRVT